jgi:hypothetical protein
MPEVHTVPAMKIVGRKSERMYKQDNNGHDDDVLEASEDVTH